MTPLVLYHRWTQRLRNRFLLLSAIVGFVAGVIQIYSFRFDENDQQHQSNTHIEGNSGNSTNIYNITTDNSTNIINSNTDNSTQSYNHIYNDPSSPAPEAGRNDDINAVRHDAHDFQPYPSDLALAQLPTDIESFRENDVKKVILLLETLDQEMQEGRTLSPSEQEAFDQVIRHTDTMLNELLSWNQQRFDALTVSGKRTMKGKKIIQELETCKDQFRKLEQLKSATRIV